jgi:hypothetical protein
MTQQGMGWIKKGYKKLYVAVNLYPGKQKIDDVLFTNNCGLFHRSQKIEAI